jgi:hypothetical protein
MSDTLFTRLGRIFGQARQERPRRARRARQAAPARLEAMERRWMMSGDALADAGYTAPPPTEVALLLPAVQAAREAARRAGAVAITDGTSNTIAFG